MRLNLREIIGVPGGRVEFDYEPDLSAAVNESVIGVKPPSRAAGSVINSAGVLTLSAIVDTVFICVCARCLTEFELPVHKRISVYLAEGGENGDSPDKYFLQGDEIDVGEVITTELVLDTDERLLCREDCAGICQQCGAELNIKPCSCKAEPDPRLAVLGQLLDND